MSDTWWEGLALLEPRMKSLEQRLDLLEAPRDDRLPNRPVATAVPSSGVQEEPGANQGYVQP